MGVEPKDATKSGEGRIYYLQYVRRTPGIFPEAVSPGTAKLGKFLFRGTCIFMKVLEQRRILHRIGARVGRVQALVN